MFQPEHSNLLKPPRGDVLAVDPVTTPSVVENIKLCNYEISPRIVLKQGRLLFFLDEENTDSVRSMWATASAPTGDDARQLDDFM